MSRNLCQTHCNDCPAPRVALVERPRFITESEARGPRATRRLVADAECPLCHAKYLAWVDETRRNPLPIGRGSYTWHRFDRCPEEYDGDYFDLSYRSAFNDEPLPEDLPTHDVSTVYVCTPKATLTTSTLWTCA